MVDIPFVRDFTFAYAVLETVSPLVRRIVARNPGPFTAQGTGTYVVGRRKVAVIDPGPALQGHVDAIMDALRAETIEQLVITHTHLDHSPAAAMLKRLTAARTYGFGPHDAGSNGARTSGPSGEEGADWNFRPDHVMADGDAIAGEGWRLEAVHTPGHTGNHLCFALPEERILFTGDHVMGWSTSVISPPDGDMAAYMNSLALLLRRDDRLYLPTHGPAITEPKPHVEAFIAHRRARTAAILAGLSTGPKTTAELVAALYVGLASGLRGAAGRSVLAHLIALIDAGTVGCDGPMDTTGRYYLR